MNRSLWSYYMKNSPSSAIVMAWLDITWIHVVTVGIVLLGKSRSWPLVVRDCQLFEVLFLLNLPNAKIVVDLSLDGLSLQIKKKDKANNGYGL